MVRRIGLGVLAAVVAGVVLGAVARGLMTLVTLASGGSPSFSWGGTVFILLLFVVVAVPGGLVAGLTTHRLRWVLPVAGAVFLCVPAVGAASGDLGSTAGFGVAEWLGAGAAGIAVFVAIALLPVLTVRLADTWLGRRRGPVRPHSPQPVG